MSTPAPTEHDRMELDLLLRGFQVSRMLRLVADLRIADKIAPDDAISVSDLAKSCIVLPDPLIRVLRALAAFGVFNVSGDGTISHTVRSLLLRTDTPNSMHYSAQFWTGPGSWKAWSMLDVAMTGAIPYEAAWKMSRFSYLRQHPEEARVFDAMMANFPDNRHAAIAAGYDFSAVRVIADIGGGNGAALRQILTRFSGPHGLVFDRDDVITVLTAEDLMNGRIAAQGGSFFDEVPGGADIYLLIRVLHDWSDEDCLRILRRCRAAMETGQVLLLGEELLEPDPARGKATAYLIDMHMMAMFGHARARSETEFRSLLAQAGFNLGRVIPTTSTVSIIEATPTAA